MVSSWAHLSYWFLFLTQMTPGVCTGSVCPMGAGDSRRILRKPGGTRENAMRNISLKPRWGKGCEETFGKGLVTEFSNINPDKKQNVPSRSKVTSFTFVCLLFSRRMRCFAKEHWGLSPSSATVCPSSPSLWPLSSWAFSGQCQGVSVKRSASTA